MRCWHAAAHLALGNAGQAWTTVVPLLAEQQAPSLAKPLAELIATVGIAPVPAQEARQLPTMQRIIRMQGLARQGAWTALREALASLPPTANGVPPVPTGAVCLLTAQMHEQEGRFTEADAVLATGTRHGDADEREQARGARVQLWRRAGRLAELAERNDLDADTAETLCSALIATKDHVTMRALIARIGAAWHADNRDAHSIEAALLAKDLAAAHDTMTAYFRRNPADWSAKQLMLRVLAAQGRITDWYDLSANERFSPLDDLLDVAPDQADAIFAEHARRFPDDPALPLERARIAYRAGRWDDALAMVEAHQRAAIKVNWLATRIAIWCRVRRGDALSPDAWIELNSWSEPAQRPALESLTFLLERMPNGAGWAEHRRQLEYDLAFLRHDLDAVTRLVRPPESFAVRSLTHDDAAVRWRHAVLASCLSEDDDGWIDVTPLARAAAVADREITDASPTLRFTAAGMVGLMVLAVCCVLLNLPNSLLRITQFSLSSYGFDILALYGFFTMVMFGATYFIVPRVTRREWLSRRLIKMHFLFSAYGAVFVALVALFGGLIEGQSQENWKQPWMEASKFTFPYAITITVSWCLILFSNIFFFLHLTLMWLRLGRRSSHPTLLVGSPHHGSPHGEEGDIDNAGPGHVPAH